MKNFTIFILVLIISFLMARNFYKEKNSDTTHEETQVVIHSIENMSKLIVSEGTFSEVYNYENAKKYFYNTFEFKKSAIVMVNAKVQVSFDLKKMDIEIDSIHKKIRIKSIPEEEINIIPKVKYYDLQQSTFNYFEEEDLNKINKNSIEKIKRTAEVSALKIEAKERLMAELSNIYQLSSILGWEVVDETETQLLDGIIIEKPIF